MKEFNTLPAASSEAQAEQLTAEVMSYKEIISQYGAKLDGNPAVYVGTYHKYNCGSLFGYQKQKTIKRKCGNQLVVNYHTQYILVIIISLECPTNQSVCYCLPTME